MRYTVTFREEDFDRLRDVVFGDPGREGAGFLLCGRSVTPAETRLLVREVLPVDRGHYVARERDHMSIRSSAYAAVAKRATADGSSILFAHSHPPGFEQHSPQDDREEPKLMRFFTDRAPAATCGSLVLTNRPSVCGRVWSAERWVATSRVRVLGRRFRLFDEGDAAADIAEFYDRQVRAFGPDVQRLLGRLHVGIVGAGGTGSAVVEQLTRLGVGTLSVFDGDGFEESNATRVYGSRVADAGKAKARIQVAHVRRIGLGTEIRAYRHTTAKAIAQRLRDCDIVFGCTDRELPRAIEVALSLRYLIPAIDVGVKIDSENQILRSVTGRVTWLFPGEACLLCTRRITPERIRLESVPQEERLDLARQGYAPELGVEDPAVVTFTTFIAAQAVSEFLHRLTGFKGEERQSSEVVVRFDLDEFIHTRRQPTPGCPCARREVWGRGDTRDFLGMTWSA